MAERLVAGNAGGGKEPQLKADARSHDGWEIGDEPDNSRLLPEVADGVTGNGYGDCVSLLRELDAGNPHVQFDERGVETEAWWE
jgi:hypothetical protein